MTKQKHSKNLIPFTPWIGLLFILLIAIPKFWFGLKAQETGNYQAVLIVHAIMLFLPFILLRKNGLKQIHWTKTKDPKWVLRGFVFGVILCSVSYLVVWLLYGHSSSNWFVNISTSYGLGTLDVTSRFKWFILHSILAMTLAPFAEELMYRGIIHVSLASRFGENLASKMDSLAFAVTQLAVFGVVFSNGDWQVLIIPSILWVALWFFCCRIFFLVRIKSGSLFGAIACHAGFNLAMTFWVFYFIL